MKKIAGAALALIVLLGAAFYAGARYEAGQGVASASTLSGGDASTTAALPGMALFGNAVDIIKAKYYDAKDVTDQDLLYGAVNGLMQALGDPYSVFFSPSDAKKFNQDLSGDFGGIGAEIGVRNGALTVVSPLKGSPAEAAGLKAGDSILAIDASSTASVSLDDAVKLIRGEPGTTVTLTVMRDGWKESKDITVTRQVIEAPTLDWEMKQGNVAYFDLYTFSANAPALFAQDATQALAKGAKGIVLDLRDDPGGFLDAATNIAGWFLPRGQVVVQEKGSGGDVTKLVASGNAALSHIPVVVLVNGGSASASEILAGALRDDRGAKLVGEQTYGKGSVQEVEDLPGGSMIKISIAEWLTPKGSYINKVGLAPDIKVQPAGENAAAGSDPQLDKAMEIVKAEMGQ